MSVHGMPLMPSSQMLLLLIAIVGLTCVGAGLVLIVLGIGLLMRKPESEEANPRSSAPNHHFYDSAPTDPRA